MVMSVPGFVLVIVIMTMLALMLMIVLMIVSMTFFPVRMGRFAKRLDAFGRLEHQRVRPVERSEETPRPRLHPEAVEDDEIGFPKRLNHRRRRLIGMGRGALGENRFHRGVRAAHGLCDRSDGVDRGGDAQRAASSRASLRRSREGERRMKDRRKKGRRCEAERCCGAAFQKFSSADAGRLLHVDLLEKCFQPLACRFSRREEPCELE